MRVISWALRNYEDGIFIVRCFFQLCIRAIFWWVKIQRGNQYLPTVGVLNVSSLANYSGRKADWVKVSVALSNSFFFLGSRWAERYDFGPQVIVLGLVFCTRLVRVTFSVVLSNSWNSRSRSFFSGREECLQYASQTCKAWTKHARHARHEQPQHKLLAVKLTGELFKLT